MPVSRVARKRPYQLAQVIYGLLSQKITQATAFSLSLLSLFTFSDADGKFTSQENYKLMGHKITQYKVREEFVCASYCLRTCRCQSFNVWKRPDGQYLCQLNNATEKEFPDDFIATDRETKYHAFVY